MEEQAHSYYRENLPTLIEKLKNAVNENLEVIDQKITSDLSEDRLLNVLKARRMASEDAVYFMKEIDKLENELNGTIGDSETQPTSHTKRMAQQIEK